MNKEEKEVTGKSSENQTKNSTTEDYIFRFPLEPEKLEVVYEDHLLELVRGLLADLLDCVVLSYHGKRVQVNGFRLLQDMDTEYKIFPDKDISSDLE